MGNDLHSLSEIVSTTLLFNYTLIYLSRGDVVISSQFYIQKPLIVAKIQIDLASISENIDFSMFIRAHCTSIAVLQHNNDPTIRYKIGINLDGSDLHSMGLKQSTQGTDCDSLSQTAQYSAGNNEIFHFEYTKEL